MGYFKRDQFKPGRVFMFEYFEYLGVPTLTGEGEDQG